MVVSVHTPCTLQSIFFCCWSSVFFMNPSKHDLFENASKCRKKGINAEKKAFGCNCIGDEINKVAFHYLLRQGYVECRFIRLQPRPAHPVGCSARKASHIKKTGVADLRYERLNIQIIETSIHNPSGFSTDFFHTLIKQRQNPVSPKNRRSL